jgi:methyl-accepting chemotaxis protein
MSFKMLRLISNYPISRRLMIAFALAAILPSVMIAIMGTYYVNQLNQRRQASSLVADAQDSANGLSASLHHMYAQIKSLESQTLAGLLSSSSMSHLTISSTFDGTANEMTTDASLFNQGMGSYGNQYDPVNSPNMQPVLQVLNNLNITDDTPQAESDLLHNVVTDSWPKYLQAQSSELKLLRQIVNAPRQYSVSSAVSMISSHASSLDTAYTDINGDWNQLISYVNGISKHVNGVDTNETQPIIVGTIGAFLLTLIIVTVAGILVHRSISGPLNELVLLTRRISRGDRGARANVTSNDEISIVATAMNNMLDSIVHLFQETQNQRDVLQGQVEKLVSEVSGVGDGDLRVSAEVTADALGVLADSFNYMIEELSSLVVRVKKVAHEVEQSTIMTSDRMDQLVQTADRQIDLIANAAMEIERMAISSQQVVNRALALANSARDARVSAQGGRQAVQQTIEGMGRIYSNVQETSGKVQTLGERSREINNIVDAISNIAHQTNRLALDAAIQAAMAGDNGKGFGAVAADIRRLAERAKELATEVGHIVRSVRDDIAAVAIAMNDTERETSSGSRLAEEAGTSLESIVAVIERQADEIEGINQMAGQQQQSSTDVVQMMQIVSETTQQNSNGTREAAQNMERVAHLAEQLLASVEAFKLRDTLNYIDLNGAPYADSADGPRTPGRSFRTVSSTAQPVNNTGTSAPAQVPATDGYFPQFPQFSPVLYPQENSQRQSGPLAPVSQEHNSKQTPFPPSNSGRLAHQFQGNPVRQAPFPSYEGVQQPFPPRNNSEPQQPFPPQNNWNPGPQQQTPPENWPTGNWN